MRLASAVLPDPSRPVGTERFVVYFHGVKQDGTFDDRALAEARLEELETAERERLASQVASEG